MQESKLTINRTAARAFINYLNLAVNVEMNPLFKIDKSSGQQFEAINQAHLIIVRDLCQLVTDKTEVFQEYDRLLEMCRANGAQGMTEMLTQARVKLSEMLEQFQRGH